MSGRRFGRLFVELLKGTQIGVQAGWISTYVNFIASDISRLKKENAGGDFDYKN